MIISEGVHKNKHTLIFYFATNEKKRKPMIINDLRFHYEVPSIPQN
jgi:hypothetical protein